MFFNQNVCKRGDGFVNKESAGSLSELVEIP